MNPQNRTCFSRYLPLILVPMLFIVASGAMAHDSPRYALGYYVERSPHYNHYKTPHKIYRSLKGRKYYGHKHHGYKRYHKEKYRYPSTRGFIRFEYRY